MALRFDPTSLGDVTADAFTFLFDASDVGLTSNGENIAARADQLDALARAGLPR